MRIDQSFENNLKLIKQTVIILKLKHPNSTQLTFIFKNIMATASCSIYGLLITSIVGTVLGITTLILSIVFKYIGFVSSDISISTCLEPYLISKYTYLSQQLLTSFVGICIAVLMFIVVIILLVLAIKSLREYQAQHNIQHFSSQILSKNKYALIYILLSFGTLGNIVCFGTYLAYIIEMQKYPNTCSFSYNYTNLLVLVIISGIWLLAFIVAHVFALMLKTFYIEDEEQQERRNKYKEMANVTEQPGNLPYRQKTQDQNILKYAEYTQDPYQGDAQSFGNNNPKQFKSKQTDYFKPQAREYKPSQHHQVLNTEESFGETRKNPQGKQTFQEYRDRQMRQLLQKKKNNNQNDPYNKTHNTIDHKKPHYLIDDYHSPGDKVPTKYELSPKNQEALKFYQPNIKTNPNNSNVMHQSRFGTNQNQDIPEENVRKNPFSDNNKNPRQANKPYSPVRMLGDSVGQPYRPNGSPNRSDSSQPVSQFGRAPQRILNNSSSNVRDNYQPEGSYRGKEEDTRGQLVFYKKAMQNSRRNDYDSNQQDFSQNQQPKKDKYSSGQLSFKSPSRFDSKFAQQEKDYLNKNAQGSILPSNGVRQVNNGSRKIAVDDKYSSSGMQNSNFGQSRNQQSSPVDGKSKAKGREGVLTSFIRGKFS